MASRQDPTAADIAYAQYSAAEKTRMVGGRVYHRIICKTPLPAPVGGVELILPRAMFRGARAGCVEDERGRVFRLADPVTLHFPGAEPPWYAQSACVRGARLHGRRHRRVFARVVSATSAHRGRSVQGGNAVCVSRAGNGGNGMWFVFALLSAVFAALTSILAKVCIEGVNSNPATAIRTMVVLAMAWVMVFVTNTQGGLTDISRKSWLFLILSGLATGASWLCYYRALQIGEASKVVPIDKLSVVITLVLAFVFLHERFTPKSLIGCLLIGAGTLLMVL